MAIEVRIPTILRTYTDGEKSVTGDGANLSALIDDLESQPPRHQGPPASTTATCAGSSTSTSTTRTCGSSAGSRPRSATATRSSCSRRSPAADGPHDAVRQPPRLGRRYAAGRAAEAVAEPRRPALGQARGPQPDRLDQGPPGAADGRGGREGRAAPPRLHDPRADVGQHRHLAGHGGQAQGLPAGLRDAGEHLRGAPPAAAHVGRRDHHLAGGRRLQRGGPGRQAGRRGAPRLGDALPVRQRGERARAPGGHRPRDPRRPAEHHPLRRRASAPPAP